MSSKLGTSSLRARISRSLKVEVIGSVTNLSVLYYIEVCCSQVNTYMRIETLKPLIIYRSFSLNFKPSIAYYKLGNCCMQGQVWLHLGLGSFKVLVRTMSSWQQKRETIIYVAMTRLILRRLTRKVQVA